MIERHHYNLGRMVETLAALDPAKRGLMKCPAGRLGRLGKRK